MNDRNRRRIKGKEMKNSVLKSYGIFKLIVKIANPPASKIIAVDYAYICVWRSGS